MNNAKNIKTSKRKKKKKISLCKIRIFVSLIVFGLVTVTLGSNCYDNLKLIKEKKNEKERLKSQVVILKEEKEILETDILKLKDADYLAKYIREKYYFSKDGELNLKLDN